MNSLVRVACVLLAGLSGGCGGGGGEAGGNADAAPKVADSRLMLDGMAWDAGDWAE